MLNEELQADLLFLDDVIALHATGVSSNFSLLIPVRSENPQVARNAIRNSRIGVFGPPQCIERKDAVRAEMRPGRRIKL